ncbi:MULTISPECIES: hypothetical protein [unclassified Rathayibacter]|uniref:hypothetical protein n=1 Tax=unclassified Rathayibacter TaxID=2609250 RepID=UPI0006FC7685|nr:MULTISPECIES: hypothetical protein [unclassified Rathayibacter]KQQ05654.1 hypothetical protein ASF42_03565 [Rathayibacter sp. Leaf294]KQS13513.1 hypothetical protein ASG06_03575 [Rathayibacter sp. Leaf185]
MRADTRRLRWRRHPDTAFVDVRGRILVLPLTPSPMSSPYAMQASVAEAWRVLAADAQDFTDIAERLALLHGVAADTIVDDLERMLTEMEKLMLVESLR